MGVWAALLGYKRKDERARQEMDDTAKKKREAGNDN